MADLEALAKIDEPIVRSDVIGRLAGGDVGSVSEALVTLQPQKPVTQPDPDVLALVKLITAWKRAPMKVKRRFLIDRRAEFEAMLADIEGDQS